MSDQPSCQACRKPADMFPFTMAFQPIIDLEANRIDAHEALVRGPGGEGAAWVLAQLTPERLYNFDQACRVKAIELAARLGLDTRLNINFLPNAVYQPAACIRLTLDAARRTGFPLDRLTFEIVESETLAQPAHLANIIAEYRRHGFQIALDDFGSGYACLQRLADFRPDTVKLDRALVQGCDENHARLAIIASMAALGRELGTKVVVEGVERASELQALRAVGIRYAQGFLFARPKFQALVPEHAINYLA